MAIKRKQIDFPIIAPIGISGFTSAGVDDVVTSVITSALSTAGDGGVSVPLQVSASNSVGVLTSGSNRVEIVLASTKERLIDASGNEIYGRLTESGGIYTLSYYSLISGVETAYTMPSTSIDFYFNYCFDAYRLPADFAVRLNARIVSDDPASRTGKQLTERLTVTALNTVSNLTKTPISGTLQLIVYGVTHTLVDSPTPFSVSGKAITWNASNAGYALETVDNVVAVYFTNE